MVFSLHDMSASEFVIKPVGEVVSLDPFAPVGSEPGPDPMYVVKANAEIERLRLENAALKQALEAKNGKSEGQLIAEANVANIRAAKAEGEAAKLRAALETMRGGDPYVASADDILLFGAKPTIMKDREKPAPQSKRWVEVMRLSKPADTTSEAFHVGTSEWRIRWVAKGDATLYVYRPERRSSVESFDSDKTGGVSQGVVYDGPGRFYLKTIGAREGWSAVIEELR